ncbi:MAG: VWA domain-containing protein [Bacteroidota bacterium]
MFRFSHPYSFYLLAAIPLLIGVFVLYLLWRKKALSRFGNKSVILQLMPEYSTGRLLFKFSLLLISMAFLILALAGLQTGSKLEKVQRKGIDIMIALDVSNSMLAEDIKPTRLERAKQAISKLIEDLEGDRIGIVVFAGKAYMQLPITTDYAAAKLFLSTINTGIISTQGTDIGSAIEMSAASFGQTKHNKAIIIITDGEDHQGNVLEQTETAVKNGIFVYTIGMGSAEGAPIPIYNGAVQTGYKKDREGNTVVSRLDETLLQRIASVGKGMYVRANTSETGLQKIFEELNKIQKSEIESKLYSDYEERFTYFLLLGLFFLLLEIIIFDKKNQWYGKFKLFER